MIFTFHASVLILNIFCDCAVFLTCTHKTNVVGTLNMLGLAKRIGARFLLTSTSEVYGDPLEHPQKGVWISGECRCLSSFLGCLNQCWSNWVCVVLVG
jgi:hypothetical protein